MFPERKLLTLPCARVGWNVHRVIKIFSWNVTKRGLFFNIAPHTHTHYPFCRHAFSVGVGVPGSHLLESFHPVRQKKKKSITNWYGHDHCDTGSQSNVLFVLGNRWWSNPEEREGDHPITNNSHWSQGLVCWSIILIKHLFRQLSWAFDLAGIVMMAWPC